MAEIDQNSSEFYERKEIASLHKCSGGGVEGGRNSLLPIVIELVYFDKARKLGGPSPSQKLPDSV